MTNSSNTEREFLEGLRYEDKFPEAESSSNTDEIEKLTKWFYTQIWNTSEFTGISLGKYAPYVFEKMLGTEGKKL